MKNHLGSYECKLCLTLHNNEVSSARKGITFSAAAVSVITRNYRRLDTRFCTQNKLNKFGTRRSCRQF